MKEKETVVTEPIIPPKFFIKEQVNLADIQI